MNDILKQRLVGALILIALGVVFWPIIFVQPGEKAAALQQPIPPKPEISTAAIEEPAPAGLRASAQLALDEEPTEEPPTPTIPATDASKRAPSPAPESARDTGQTRTKAPRPLVVDSDGVPEAWIIQVASVSSENSAQELRKRLLEMEQKAYVKTVRRDGKNLYRVYVGPKFERAKLEKLQAQIDAEFGVTSMVVRYLP